MSTRQYSDAEAWDGHTRKFRDAPGGMWRRYCDRLHLGLIEEWLSELGPRILKTDLFDEAIGDGVLGRVGSDSARIGVDISPSVVEDAVRREESIRAMVADLRHLPISTESVDSIISNSSLDHFETERELLQSLAELHRVLRVDGSLLITLDNPINPIIALRRLLPYRLLHQLGLLPYPVGATLSLRRLRRELLHLGFVIEEERTIMHIPRVLAIPFCRRLDRTSYRSHDRPVERMLRAERMRRLPLHQVTGHFIAALARKL